MMDNLFNWYPVSVDSSSSSDSTLPPSEDDFNEILGALDLLKNV